MRIWLIVVFAQVASLPAAPALVAMSNHHACIRALVAL
jgi:hypothetical protein